jgi:acetyl-CoA carboxylase/biotin carboxylase 1
LRESSRLIQPRSSLFVDIYKAEGKENSSDVRFFIRALVRPGRLQGEPDISTLFSFGLLKAHRRSSGDTTGSMRTAEYLISECDRLVTDIMDALEVVGAESRNADCNHVAINFIYNVLVDFDDVQEALAGFIERHGKRLWRLRVTAAEIRMSLEDDEGNITPIRCCIENVSGFVVKYHAYQEIETDKGTPILRSIGEPGPFHLQSVNHPYMTKNSLQPRRYQAHLVGTTYVCE